MHSVFITTTFVASALAFSAANAQSICDAKEKAEHNTFTIAAQDGRAFGTAFPIDSRGLFLTAKHLIYQLDVQELTVRRADGTVSFPIAGVIHSGAYNRTDLSKLNPFDDWSIFWIEVDTYDGDVFPFLYDRASGQDFSSLSAHSYQGVSNVTATIARAPYPSDACSSEAMIVASLNRYRKTSSGAPISYNQCVFGVTSRFDASYQGFVTNFSDNLDAIESLNSLSVEIYERLSSNELYQNFIEELLGKVDDENLRSCIEDSKTQCMAQHVDKLRDTLSTLDAVVITPMSCVAETIVTEYFDRNNDELRVALKGLSSTSKVRELLDVVISSDMDALGYAQSIQSRANIVHWSWLSYVELVEKYLVLADTTEINVKPIRTALVNIGSEISSHGFREAIRDAYRKVKDEEFRRQIAELEAARSAAIEEFEEKMLIADTKEIELRSHMKEDMSGSLDADKGEREEFLQLERELEDAEQRLRLAETAFEELNSDLAQLLKVAEDYRQRASLVDTQLAQLPTVRIEGMSFDERLQIYEANLTAVIDPRASDRDSRIFAPFEGLDIPQVGPFIAKDTRTPLEHWLDLESDVLPRVQNNDGLDLSPDLMVPSDQIPGVTRPPLVDNLGDPGTGFPFDGDVQGFPGGFQSAPLR